MLATGTGTEAFPLLTINLSAIFSGWCCSPFSDLPARQWNFGDGNFAAGMTASHNYTATGSFTVCVKATNACGSDSSCRVVTVLGVGLGSIMLIASLAIYPNLATKTITVEKAPPNTCISIYTITGKCLRKVVLAGNKKSRC